MTFLDWFLGPRTCRVVRLRGAIRVVSGARIRGEVVIADGLRWGAAVRLARKMRKENA